MTSALATTIITTILSSITAVAVTLLVNVFAIRREREADWRKLKLDRYQEFISALSEIVGSRSNSGRQERYANAISTLILVAPEAVVAAVYRLQDEISVANKTRDTVREYLLLTELVREIRRDLSPGIAESQLTYRLFDVPPEKA